MQSGPFQTGKAFSRSAAFFISSAAHSLPLIPLKAAICLPEAGEVTRVTTGLVSGLWPLICSNPCQRAPQKQKLCLAIGLQAKITFAIMFHVVSLQLQALHPCRRRASSLQKCKHDVKAPAFQPAALKSLQSVLLAAKQGRCVAPILRKPRRMS